MRINNHADEALLVLLVSGQDSLNTGLEAEWRFELYVVAVSADAESCVSKADFHQLGTAMAGGEEQGSRANSNCGSGKKRSAQTERRRGHNAGDDQQRTGIASSALRLYAPKVPLNHGQ
ncbi:MAG: hypothetical protein OXI34_18155 [Chloroflexota bacterium]|nr:hypothetical protein [Chloroflexota bacterium]MDE2947563.1 hypothetical protein [Chloroflexota bacterium]